VRCLLVIAESVCCKVVDYLDKVRHPMDFSTMSEKIDGHCYAMFDAFVDDFQLVISNCLLYNEAGSCLHRYADKMHKKVHMLCNVYFEGFREWGHCYDGLYTFWCQYFLSLLAVFLSDGMLVLIWYWNGNRCSRVSCIVGITVGCVIWPVKTVPEMCGVGQ